MATSTSRNALDVSKGKPLSVRKLLEADARAVVAVDDDIGGTVIYLHGRPAYYVLDGEWLQAVAVPSDVSRSAESVSTS